MHQPVAAICDSGESVINKRALAIAACINIFFIVLCIVFGDIQYGAVDDYFMAAVLTGAHGSAYNPHMMFVNAIYGYALLPLYHLFPAIGWYYVGEMFSVFLSFTTISYIIIQKMGNRWGALSATFFVAFFASDFYQVVQFTRCASILSATGMFVFAYAVTLSAKKSNTEFQRFAKVLPFIYAVFLLLWGSIMRWDAFLMGMPFFALTMLFLLRECWTSKIHVLIGIAVMFIAAFSLHSFDRSLYQNDTYRPYIQIQGPRATFGDAGNYNQNAVYEDLEEMGKSGIDYSMLTSWIFYDTETFARDSMMAIINVINQYQEANAASNLPKQLMCALANSLHRPVTWGWFIACLLIFASNRKKFTYLWASLAVMLFMMILLLARNRLFYHVESGLWLYATFMAIPLWNKIRIQINSKIVIAILAIVGIANIATYAKDGDNVRDPVAGNLRTTTVSDSTDYKKVFSYIEQNKDKMFLASMNSYMKFSHHKMPPYRAEPFGSFKNIVSLGYWTPYLPEITESLKEYGITNPIKDVVHDNVIVIDEDGLCDFLQRHYYDSVAVDTLNVIDKMTFYKYRLVN